MHRHFLAVAGAAALLLATAGAPLRAYEYQQIFGQPLVGMEGRPRAVAPPRELVAYNGRYAPGTIVISTEERRLYYILPGNQAVKYGIGVGRPGFEWSGTRRVAMKREWPSWTPPSQMLRRRPDLPRFMPGGRKIRSARVPCILAARFTASTARMNRKRSARRSHLAAFG